MDGGVSALTSPPTTHVEPVSEAADVSRHMEESMVTVPVMEADRPTDDPFLTGVPFSSTCYFTLSPSINLYTKNLNLSSLDWVEG